jgi:sterol 3beta-glucosyltransferase
MTTAYVSARSSSGDDEFANGSPALPRLFNDASLYQKFLNNHQDHGSIDPGDPKHKHEVVKGFADLIAGDLNPGSPEKAITDRLAKLAVTGDSWPDAEIFAEPEAYESDSDDDELPPEDGKTEKRPWELAPDEIVKLLIQEFGPLTVGGEEEKLIIEADGAWLHDVVILVRGYVFLIFCCL